MNPYISHINIPVFACDTGLYLEVLKTEDQPGVNVRRIKGKELSDNEMIEHYSEISRKNGGEKMLSLCLDLLRKEGLNRVLITCNTDNIGSQKIIENNMGILENIINGSRRYWINL